MSAMSAKRKKKYPTVYATLGHRTAEEWHDLMLSLDLTPRIRLRVWGILFWQFSHYADYSRVTPAFFASPPYVRPEYLVGVLERLGFPHRMALSYGAPPRSSRSQDHYEPDSKYIPLSPGVWL